MAKKKTRKEVKKEFSGKLEIYGILLILLAIIGVTVYFIMTKL